MINKEHIASRFKELQQSIINHLEGLDAKSKFEKDTWKRNGGGGGITAVIQDGKVFEKGGVNFSEVFGETPDQILKALKLEKSEFYATGVSIVIHPENPHVPIIHMNIRYFEMSNGIYWFGGGIDLTPIYIITDHPKYFHESMKGVCDQHNQDFYPKFKKWADDYFFIKHRNETRGIGGIFFDRLTEQENLTKENIFDFVYAVGSSFIPTYKPIVEWNKEKVITEEDKNWQLLRRGRYVEFNLVYDKGTKFGLDTNGRVESILMSLPKFASWQYDVKPKEGSEAAKTLSLLKKGIDWININ